MKVTVYFLAPAEITMKIAAEIEVPDMGKVLDEDLRQDALEKYVMENFTMQQLIENMVDDEIDTVDRIGDDDPKIYSCRVEEV